MQLKFDANQVTENLEITDTKANDVSAFL